ncbi:valine--tRNA ligase [Oleiharenicola lentus]|uniref:valine--tRNA ligase n=1 Tax=Oleiharenicola lentus TaxID=2508720 RepID=UPI003F681AF4
MASITKSYESRDVEKKWYAAWLEAGCFAGKANPVKKPYTIMIPPPNVTGVLTMGHVLNNTIQDILIRRARLEGREALWLPGTDHAGIATQTVVEKELRKEKKTRHDLGREKFIEKVWSWREEKGGIILKQLQGLGASADWSRTQFTMDPAYSQAVLKVFVDLYGKGHIYRGKRMVNWCPASLTALSDEEVDMRPTKGTIYQIRYELVDQPGRFIEVKTTRPETIPGDVAIAVHPDDPRYTDIVGQKVWRPLNRTQIPIIADAAVDKEFGSGALKITPAHDKVDFEVGQRHKLVPIDVLTPDAKLNELAGPELAGLERFAGRKKAAELLKDLGALVKEEPYENNVGYSERAGVPIEPRLTWQWWLRYPKVEEAKTAVRDGHIKFYPDRWSKVYLHWLENIQDWCISRQVWWGHRIPVWYAKGVDKETLTEADLLDPTKVHISLEGPADKTNWTQESDVLDTWASSWLWPFATLGWPDKDAMEKAGFDYFYPTSTLVTGPDIIFFWVARMIMAGLEFIRPGELLSRRIPFKNVYFTGIIRDQQGRKMSKSLGNSPDPLDLIEKYGADGLRFGIISIAPQGQDIRFQEERIEGGKNFCNKLWNASRFRQMSGEMADNSSIGAILARVEPAKFDADDHAIMDRLLSTTREVDRAFTEFEFSAAVQTLYGFFWNDFCDWYVEVSKAKLQDPETKANCLAIQDLVLRQTLVLLHPFTPFITEELWHLLGYGAEGTYLMRDVRLDNPSQLAGRGLQIDHNAAAQVGHLKAVVSQVRAFKAEQGEAASKVSEFVVEAPDHHWAVVEANLAKLKRMVGAASITRGAMSANAPATVTLFGSWNLIKQLKGDPAVEKVRLQKEIEAMAKHIAGTQARLSNEAFVSKAPPAVLDGARKQLADQQAKKAELERLLAALG